MTGAEDKMKYDFAVLASRKIIYFFDERAMLIFLMQQVTLQLHVMQYTAGHNYPFFAKVLLTRKK